MEIKVGQWKRDITGKIEKVTKRFLEYYNGWEDKNSVVTYTNLKVANTPHELIEVGDLTKTNYAKDVFSINDYNMGHMPKKDIIKIWTPNSNGGYDLQWEANNER